MTVLYYHCSSVRKSESENKFRINLVTPWYRVLYEKCVVPELVKKFQHILFNLKFNYSVYKSLSVPILAWMNTVHNFSPYSLRSTLLLFSHLCLGFPSGLFPACFSTFHADLTLDLITLILFV